ncbi:MAG: 3-hydroxybutyrate dehydrogenase [Armatimonadota bacterium]|nr:3-hydroxybutyrate dehydrogenase [Armatimonadota bacterium]MDR7485762.1 3-hydroxybutyrate dehydrogenase [Armatimonadota bacterium]MDR7534104.1 3-hydroxybutyrate dehydrogenase [Armatimonadota bacterium]MDR7537559.1 3-hydroxybutyrate dehydrogenase [Armatimonadota bacterium]
MTTHLLDGRAAIVTGAGSGIGRAIALALARAGAAVGAADVDGQAAARAADEVGTAGGRGVAVTADVGDARAVAAMVETVVGAFGRLDILVNNAGLQHVAPIVDYPEDRWHRLIGVMLTGTFLCTKHALPHMIRRRWGRVINIASAHGLVASPFKSAYVAAKHGVVGFTKVAAWEVGEHGVTVNAICPGYVRTPLVEGQIADQARVHGIAPAEVVEKVMLPAHAVKRLIEADEVAALAVFLCTDAAAMITGAALPLDAGWTAR